MLPYATRLVLGLIGTGLMMTFVIGLIYSISTGFAGFWGGLPVWIISMFVLSLAGYDYFDECVRKKQNHSEQIESD